MNARAKRRLNRLANAGLAAAALVLCVPAGMRAWGQWSETRSLERLKSRLPNAARVVSARTERRTPLVPPPRQPFSSSLVDIPSIGVQAVVDEGSGNWEMMLGAGHEPGSPGAGGSGNCVIAAHRNMWGALFAELPRVKVGDLVHVTDERGTYTYQVEVSREVTTRERRYLHQSKDALLTLYTCVLPFDEDRRWVVQSRLVERHLFREP